MAKNANGEGSYTYDERKKRWCYRITADGKRHAFYGKTKSEARDKGIAAQARVMQGQAAVNSGMVFSDLADEWLNVYKANLQPYTKTTYKAVIENQIKPAIGKYKLGELKNVHIQKMISDAVTAGLSSSVVKKMKVFTNAILEVAVDNNLIYQNPCAKIKLPSIPKRAEKEIFTEEEVNKIIEYAPEYAKKSTATNPCFTGWAIVMLLKAGLRLEELLALRWNDIRDNKICINQVVSIEDKKPYIKDTPKTESSRRMIPMHELVRTALNNLPHLPNKYDLVFTTTTANIIEPHNFRRSYKRYLVSAGVRYLSPHSCRHTFASNLRDANVDAKTTSELLGHADVSLTLNIYTHTDDKAKIEAINKL